MGKVREIGETFKAKDGTTLEVHPHKFNMYERCKGCYYFRMNGYWNERVSSCVDIEDHAGECAGHFRPDKTNVIFKAKDHGRKTEKN